MKPASLNVLALVPLCMTKFSVIQFVFPSKIMSFFKKKMQVFGGFVVLFDRKRWRSIHADYVICNIQRKMLMAKKQTQEKTNDGPMKRL